MSDARYFPCPSCGGLNRIPAAKVTSGPRCGRCQAPLRTDGLPVQVDDDALERLVRASPVPVLVDFYADWCGPCRALSPVLAQLAQRHAGRLIVAKVDTERHARFAGQLGVQGIPAVFLFRDGELVDRATGARPLPAWEQMVSPHL